MIKDALKGTGALIAGALALLIVGLLIASMFLFGWGFWSNATANFRGKVDARNQINANGSYRIAAYDHFFDLCQQVQSDEASIQNNLDELKTTTDGQRKVVLNASITALRNQRADLITKYNTDSEKSYTVGQFKSSNLPYRIDLEGPTTCHA